MTDDVCVLERSNGARRGARKRRLTSRRAIDEALSHMRPREVWVVRSARRVEDLVRAMASAAPGVRTARLVSYFRPEGVSARLLDAAFDRSLLGAHAMVPFEELEQILGTPHPEDYCVGAEWCASTGVLALWRGDLSVLVVGTSEFPPRGGVVADPARLSVEDSGQTVRMGDYEVSFDALLYARDSVHRRRARRRMVQEEQGLGASIRRLRLLRRLARDDLPGVSSRTLARIERGEVLRPHRRTLAVLAERLGVTVDELGEY